MNETYEQRLGKIKEDYILYDHLPKKIRQYFSFDCPFGFGSVTGKLGTEALKISNGDPDKAILILKVFMKEYA